MSEETGIGKKIAFAGGVVTLILSIAGGVFLFEDRYMLKADHEQEMTDLRAEYKEEIKSAKEEGFRRIDHMSSIQNIRMMDIEIGLINLSIESKLKIPVDKRPATFEFDLRELELQRQFLIKHKTDGERND